MLAAPASIKFAHMSDCHLGSWSGHPDMKDMSLLAFETAMGMCIDEGVDFIIIAGDLFDTSLPGVDVLKRAAAVFYTCREAGVPVYIIAGSHDYSPTGKTMLSVFEHAGLVVDIAKCEDDGEKLRLKFTADGKTGAKLAGVFGRKGSLEVESFSRLELPEEDGLKIFVFHCGIDEHSAIAGANYVPVSMLPKGFSYYASGHIHIRKIYGNGPGCIAFPGPLFPTSFDELEGYDSGFYIVTCNGRNTEIERKNVKLFNVVSIDEDAADKTPPEVESSIFEKLDSSLDNSVLLLKIHGTLKSGMPMDINFKSIAAKAESLGALAIKKNVSKLLAKDMEQIAVENVANIDELEKMLIAKHADKIKIGGRDAQKTVLSLMHALKDEKGEDETIPSFEERVKENVKRLLGL